MPLKPTNPFQAAEDAIRRRFASEGFRGELKYDPAKVIETDRWWWIPCGWIGSFGCIVNKHDLYVNWLGSALHDNDAIIWGHEHDIFCDLVDFTFAADTETQLVENLVLRFDHMNPNAAGLLPVRPVPYRETEVAAAVARHFPTFKRHFAWLAIPQIRHAYENEGLRFTCVLSDT